MPGCNRSLEVGRASDPCTLWAGLATAGKGLSSAKLTKKVLISVGLVFFF